MNDTNASQISAYLRRIADELTLLRLAAERMAPPKDRAGK